MTDQELIAALRQQVETLKQDVSIWKASAERWAQRHAEVHAQVETLTQHAGLCVFWDDQSAGGCDCGLAQRQNLREWVATTIDVFVAPLGVEASAEAIDTLTQVIECRAKELAEQQLASLAAAQERMTAFVAKIAAIGMCTDPSEESKCYMDSGPGCGAHWRNIDDEITEAREVLAALPSLAASSRETTKDEDTRQSSPSPVRTTRSPRSPQPKGSEQ